MISQPSGQVSATSFDMGRRQSSKYIRPSALPRTLLRLLRKIMRLLLDYQYDITRYIRYSGTLGSSTRNRLEAKLIINYHGIEKGLALRETRIGFGKERVKALLRDLDEYISCYGCDETVGVCLKVLEAYLNFHRSQGYTFEAFEEEFKRMTKRCKEIQDDVAGGVREVYAAHIRSEARGSFPQLVHSRHSIRQFASRRVGVDIIREAISLAIRTPSVCNRPSWRVRAYEGVMKDRLLALQHGNRGFGHEVPMLLVVTGDLEYFEGNRERNQVYIDGGLFAMTLIYALHYLGLGTCPLNLCNDRKVDQALRRVAQIPPSETFIMMIAVGYMEDRTPVTCSERPSVERVFVSN